VRYLSMCLVSCKVGFGLPKTLPIGARCLLHVGQYCNSVTRGADEGSGRCFL
jgi:hypothetical protein